MIVKGDDHVIMGLPKLLVYLWYSCHADPAKEDQAELTSHSRIA
jgi:hypothetical protein